MGSTTSGTAGNGNAEAEREPSAGGTGNVSSWGTGRRGWATGIMKAAITRWERVTGTEPRGGSELRLSLLKICEQRGRDIITRTKVMKNKQS